MKIIIKNKKVETYYKKISNNFVKYKYSSNNIGEWFLIRTVEHYLLMKENEI